jgi:hypothetical protein
MGNGIGSEWGARIGNNHWVVYPPAAFSCVMITLVFSFLLVYEHWSFEYFSFSMCVWNELLDNPVRVTNDSPFCLFFGRHTFGVVWIPVYETFTPLSLGIWNLEKMKKGTSERREKKHRRRKEDAKGGTAHVELGGFLFYFGSAVLAWVRVHRLSTLLSCTD